MNPAINRPLTGLGSPNQITPNSLPTSVNACTARCNCSGVCAAETLLHYIVALAEASREHADVALGASPRAALNLLRCARARALLDGRHYCTHEDVQAVALGPKGVIEGTQVKIFIDVSTTGSVYAKRIAEGLAKKGIVQVDAPVSGGVKGAENGTLAVMVSCSDEIYARVQAILAVIGKLFHVGKEPGQGQTMKLMNNLLSATAMAISSVA